MSGLLLSTILSHQSRLPCAIFFSKNDARYFSVQAIGYQSVSDARSHVRKTVSTYSRQESPPFRAGEECRGPGFPLFAPSVRIVECRLRHSAPAERDGSPTGSFPTERSGFQARTPCLGKTFSVDTNAPCPACWARTGRLSDGPDVSVDEAKAAGP